MLRRWILRVLGALAAVVLLLVCGVWLVGRDLDRPWIKSRVVGYCRDELGLGIDYEGLEVSLLGGVKARSFRLLTPQSLASGGEDFVRIGDLDVRARLWAFAFGERRVESLRIGSVDVAVVQDENGRTTLTELFPPAPEPEPKAPTRLSPSSASTTPAARAPARSTPSSAASVRSGRSSTSSRGAGRTTRSSSATPASARRRSSRASRS